MHFITIKNNSMKIVLEFNSMSEMEEWALSLVADTKPAKVRDIKPTQEKPDPPPAASSKKTGTLIDEIKTVGVQLSDADKHEGVQAVMKKYGVTKLKDIKEEDQETALSYFKKMLKADAAKFKAMLEALA